MNRHFLSKVIHKSVITALFLMVGCKTIVENDSDRNQGAGHLMSIGVFSGNANEEKQLQETLGNYGIQAGLEGSVFYDIYVPASKAAMSSSILRTNVLTSAGKVRLY
jgi:hypothetical protein